MEFLKKEVGNLGYAYAKINPNFHQNQETGVVDLQYQIIPGKKVTINDVLISGNDITKDRVIRRYIYLTQVNRIVILILKIARLHWVEQVILKKLI